MCTKFQVNILKNGWDLPFWMPKKAVFYAIYGEFGNFPIFTFRPILAIQKVFQGDFLRSWRKSDLKTFIKPLKPIIINLTFIDLVTLDDPDLMQGHKMLKRVLRIIKDTIHVVPSALFQFDAAALPGEASEQWQIFKNLTFHPTCDVISAVQINFCNIFGKSKPGLSKTVFGSRIGWLVWQIAGGGGETAPAPIGG